MEGKRKLYYSRMLLKQGFGSRSVKRLAVKGVVGRVGQDFEELMGNLGVKVISDLESEYPMLLKHIDYPPFLLHCIGNTNLLEKTCITIVGSRNLTKYSYENIRRLFSVPAFREHLVYVSGLARGVDAEVHQLALDLDIPTIAVVAGGIDRGFPKSNQKLYERICRDGLVIAEFPPGRTIVKGMFPLRNRILAGLSNICIIVQAAKKSGAKITANYAADFGREVYTIPANIDDPVYSGNLELIESGAGLIDSKNSFIKLIDVQLSDLK